MVMGTYWSFFNIKVYTVKDFCGLDNYVKVLSRTQYIAITMNEIVHFKGGFRTLIYVHAVIPGIATMLMWYFMYYPDHTGLLNMILGKFGVEPKQCLNASDFVIVGIIIYST